MASEHPQKTAILLAAGRARRLGSLTDNRPKCLLEVGDRTLIEHQVDSLRRVGVERFVVVVGYRAEQVRRACGKGVEYVRNDAFATTNSLYSLGLAMDRVSGGFVLTNADVLYDPELLSRLLDSRHKDALLFEPGVDLGDEEMKVRISAEGRVTAMAKSLRRGEYSGENLGVLKFSDAAVERLRPIVQDLLRDPENARSAWAPRAFDTFCRENELMAVPTGGLPWVEIDFPDDLAHARDVVWPRIRARHPHLQSTGQQARQG